MRRGVALLLVLVTPGCAYYNGLYNARGLVRRAESAASDGREETAIAAWRQAAAKADTVVQRYPRSRWIDDALFVSGTSSAFAGDCTHGLARLAQWEGRPARSRQHRARVTVARGTCLVRRGEFVQALDSLAPFASAANGTVGRIAAAWAARAALATARRDSAVRFARIGASDALDAELASAALGSDNPNLAVRLLSQRATEWRSLAGLHTVLQMLNASDRAAADSIVELAHRGRASRLDRARLTAAAGTWAERDGQIGRARGHYQRALETSSDSGVGAEINARLGLLDVRSAFTLDQAQSLLEQAKTRTPATPELARADSTLRLAARLAALEDSSGAALFLAAEVARDGARADLVARTLFLRAAREHPRSSLAPKALLAAADLSPDSAVVWRATVRSRYATTPYAQLLDGKPVSPASLEGDERLLRQAWTRVSMVGDSASVVSERRRP